MATWAGKTVLVLGLGDTGLSCVRWLAQEGARLRGADTRQAPPGLGAVREAVPGIRVDLGPFRPESLAGVDAVAASPGIALREPILREALARGIEVVGDVEIFGREVARAAPGARVIGITGTNGKSTVTALAGAMARAAGLAHGGGRQHRPAGARRAARGAGLGPPAGVGGRAVELPAGDHLQPRARRGRDAQPHAGPPRPLRHDAGLRRRQGAHLRPLRHARAQPRRPLEPRHGRAAARVTFGLGEPARGRRVGHRRRPARAGRASRSWRSTRCRWRGCTTPPTRWPRTRCAAAAAWRREPLAARHPRVPRAAAPRRARGGRARRRRSTTIPRARTSAPRWPRSRACARRWCSSPAATARARTSRRSRPAVRAKARAVVLIGRDARRARGGASPPSGVPCVRAATMEAAVEAAFRLAAPGDAVLLSPACASLDMFANYKQRGEVFAAAARALAGRVEG